MAKQHFGTECIFAQEAHLRSIPEAAPDAILVIGEKGFMLSFSASSERMRALEASS